MASADRIPKILEGIKLWNKDRGAVGAFNPSNLSVHDRRLCVQFLRIETNLSLTHMAIVLGVSRRTIIRDVYYMNQATSMMLDEMDVDAIRNEFYQEYRVQKERARQAGDKNLEWKITCDYLDRLPLFGLLKAPITNKTDIHIGDKIINANESDQTKQLVDKITADQRKRLLIAIESSGVLNDGKE